MTKQDATERIATLIIQFLSVSPDRARYVADKIYAEIVAVAVEEERDDFIKLAKFPDNLN